MKFYALLFLSCPILALSQNQIRGRVIDWRTQNPIVGTEVKLLQFDNSLDSNTTYFWALNKYRTLSSASTDSSGTYSFRDLSTGVYAILASCPVEVVIFNEKIWGERGDLQTEIPIGSGCIAEADFQLSVYCPYTKNIDTSFCPKCLKKDMLKAIIYGLPLYDAQGNLPDLGYNMGCFQDSYCEPRKYCKRCDLLF